MNPVRISVGTRLHCGLIDLGFATRRIFGGCGIALEAPRSVITWAPLDRDEIVVEDLAGVDSRTRATVGRALGRLRTRSHAVGGRLIVEHVAPQHVGLGVTTSLVLGALQAVNASVDLGLNREQLKVLSGRGGASGVGLTSFFGGGFLIDAGRLRAGHTEFHPSGFKDATSRPTHIASLEFPSEWSVRLLLPPGRRWHGAEEVEFFRQYTPVPDTEILEVLSIIYHSIVPSIVEKDVVELQRGLHGLNCVGFKRCEVTSHGPAVRALLDRLSVAGIPAGMSSMGPLVYAIGPTNILDRAAREASREDNITDFGVVNVRNINTAAVDL